MRSFTFGFCCAAGFSLLAAGLAVPAVHAQTLTLGTSLAASAPSSGSAILSAAGTSVLGTAAFSGGAGASTTSYSSVNEYDASAITLLKGGSVNSLTAYENSQVTVSGGSVGTLTTTYGAAPDFFNTAGFSVTSGTVGSINHNSQGAGAISGGTVGDVSLNGYSSNTLNLTISGGNVGNVTVTNPFQGGNAVVSGGSIKSLTMNGGYVAMSGGSLSSLTLGIEPEGSTGVVTTTNARITGGHISTLSTMGGAYPPPFSPLYPISDCVIGGGTFDTLIAGYHGGYDIYGSGLQLTNAGYVTGTLSDGEAINALFTNTDLFGGTGFLNLHDSPLPAAVPEASTTVSLGLLLMLGLGGLGIAKRRRQAA